MCLGENELDEALTVGEALAFILRTKGATEDLEQRFMCSRKEGGAAEMQWGQ